MPPQSTLSYSFEVVKNSIDFPHRMLENGNFSCSRPSRNKELPPTSLAKGELSILKGEAVFFGKHQSEKLSGEHKMLTLPGTAGRPPFQNSQKMSLSPKPAQY